MTTLATLTAALAASTSLALSDGTPVTFVKITGKDNIQVRLPDDHAYAAGQDNGRIFRRDGSHYKDQTDLTLVIAAPAAAPVAAPAPAAAPISADNDVTYLVEGNSFSSQVDAIAEAIDIFRDTGNVVEITAVTSRVIGKVGFVALAA